MRDLFRVILFCFLIANASAAFSQTHKAESGKLSGGANTQSCPGCSNGAIVINFGAGNNICYDRSSGTYNVCFNGHQVISHAYAFCNSNVAYYSDSGYTSRTYSSAPVSDNFGRGTRHVITLDGPGLLQMQQVFYVYTGKNYFFTEVLLNGEGAGCNKMSPLSSGMVNIPGSGDMRALFVPFDNDAWIRYNAGVLSTANFTGSEVAGLYDNTSCNGLIIGSVEHTDWKTGVTVKGSGTSSLSNLTVYGGFTDVNTTRDIRGHGWVNAGGTSCKSPKILVDYDLDWRNGFETFGAAVALAEPRYIRSWTGGTPFGWNSWGALQQNLTLDKAKSVVDFFAHQCRGFRTGDSTLYIDLDSYWDNLSPGGLTGDFSQLTGFVNYCISHGFKPGIYWAPFADWSKDSNKIVEGTSYLYKDCWTTINGQYKDLNGNRVMDPTHPATRGRIAYLIGRFKACGFKMIKLDFLGNAQLEADGYYDGTVHTGMQAFRKGMEYIVDQIGGTMLVYAAISPNLATGRYAHMRRIACDAFKSVSETAYTLNSTTYGWWQKNIYNFLDGDHLVFGTETRGTNRVRLTSGIVTGTLITGDDYSAVGGWDTTAKTLLQNQDILDIARNGKGRAFQPVEGNTGDQPNELFVSKIGHYWYLAIVNYGSGSKNYDISLNRIGLNGSGTYSAIKELFSAANVTATSTLSVTVPASDAAVYRIDQRGYQPLAGIKGGGGE